MTGNIFGKASVMNQLSLGKLEYQQRELIGHPNLELNHFVLYCLFGEI
jgi:hypothetical protein